MTLWQHVIRSTTDQVFFLQLLQGRDSCYCGTGIKMYVQVAGAQSPEDAQAIQAGGSHYL